MTTMTLTYVTLWCVLVATASAKTLVAKGHLEEVPQCEFEGETYNLDDVIPRDDPCMNCFCGPEGHPLCVMPMCAPPQCGFGQEILPLPGSCCKANCSSYCVFDERHYEEGEDIPNPDPCTKCHCDAQYGISCLSSSCALPECPDDQPPVRPPGACCPICPEPAHKGTCRVEGVTYKAKEEVPSGDPCEKCFCRSSGKVNCRRALCGIPHCPGREHPISAPDVCCSFCPPRAEQSGPTGEDLVRRLVSILSGDDEKGAAAESARKRRSARPLGGQ